VQLPALVQAWLMALRSEELCDSSRARAVAACFSVGAWAGDAGAVVAGPAGVVVAGVVAAGVDADGSVGPAEDCVTFAAFEPLATGDCRWLNGCATST
jgi:hypothetical protein